MDEETFEKCSFCGKEMKYKKWWSAYPRDWVCSDQCLYDLDKKVHPWKYENKGEK